MSPGRMSGMRCLHKSCSLLTNTTLLEVFSSNLETTGVGVVRVGYIPALDDAPTSREECGGVQYQTDAQALRVVTTQQPDEVFDHLIVHTAETELLEVEHDTEVVDHLLETFLARLLLRQNKALSKKEWISCGEAHKTIHNELGQFIDVSLVDVVVPGRDIDDRSADHVSVTQYSSFVALQVLLHNGIVFSQRRNVILTSPFVGSQSAPVATWSKTSFSQSGLQKKKSGFDPGQVYRVLGAMKKMKSNKNFAAKSKTAPRVTGGTRKRRVEKPKKNLGSLSVEEFFSRGISDSDDGAGEFSDEGSSLENGDDRSVNAIDDEVSSAEDYDDISGGKISEDDKEEVNEQESVSHKHSLKKLKNTDPEFYKFLEENDKNLLQFSVSDSESDQDEEDDKIHVPPDKLEVGSDESDYEDGGDLKKSKGETVQVTLKMVSAWREQLVVDKSPGTIRTVVKAFHAALHRVSAEEDDDSQDFKVAGGSVFNAVVQLCVLELHPALKRILKLTSVSSKIDPAKAKKWVKVKTAVKSYIGDLLRLLGGVSSPHVLSVLLKHLHQLIPFVTCFRNLSKPVLKRLVVLWSSAEDTVRVIAFLCLLRLITTKQKELLNQVLKKMYIAYVNNCKFMSPNTLSGINFMRRSLTEIYALDDAASYQHVFLYVRQLAIHLRNAITLKKREHLQSVYNWQFTHSLHLWVELLGATANRSHLQPLLYPLVQVIIGTINLIPTSQYYALRFHLTQLLINLSKNTNVFIPILPFLLDVLNSYDFNKHHKKVSMKPLDFTCILRLSKSQLQENGFKDAVIEKIYQQILEYLANEAHRISFPDTVVPTVIQIKTFLKTCKVSNYCKKLRQVMEKIEENSRFIENERRKVAFSLDDRKAIEAWESTLKESGVPLQTFYASWNKLHVRQVAKSATDNEKLGEYNIPVLKKFQKRRSEEVEGPVVLFPSDDESEGEGAFGSDMGEPRTKRKKRTKKIKQQTLVQPDEVKIESDDENDVEDVVEDLRLSDIE
uniref:Nucleolar complex protein 2 homolog n=1 Tax=Timema genevievae TaxID=629358 RepID=A0A7R9PKK5_TIMGE|nr:unnamed protein product [Timema genevievae]